MITYVSGDLFTSPAQVLVNTVNVVGVMGKGIAKEFKTIFPEMFQVYQQRCESGQLTIGRLLLYKTQHKWILNFPTKRHWKQKSRLEDIEAGLRTFVAKYDELGIASIAFPQLGCGNGELDWETQVRPLMERYLGQLPIDIYIHIYERGVLLPEHRDRRLMKTWLRSEPTELAFSEFWEDLVEFVRGSFGEPLRLDGWHVDIQETVETTFIEFRRVAEAVRIPKEDVFDLWQRFRTTGLLSPHDLPVDFERVADQFVALLCQLAYIEPVSFISIKDARREPAHSTEELLFDDRFRGARLVPMYEIATKLPEQVTFGSLETAICPQRPSVERSATSLTS